MTVGDKIKKIRTFRGMTQKELGVAIGLEEKGADNRVAQYETNYRVPKKDLLNKIAEVLRVDRQNFYTDARGAQRTLCGRSSGWTRIVRVPSDCFSLSAIRAKSETG